MMISWLKNLILIMTGLPDRPVSERLSAHGFVTIFAQKPEIVRIGASRSDACRPPLLCTRRFLWPTLRRQ